MLVEVAIQKEFCERARKEVLRFLEPGGFATGKEAKRVVAELEEEALRILSANPPLVLRFCNLRAAPGPDSASDALKFIDWYLRKLENPRK